MAEETGVEKLPFREEKEQGFLRMMKREDLDVSRIGKLLLVLFKEKKMRTEQFETLVKNCNGLVLSHEIRVLNVDGYREYEALHVYKVYF